MKRLAIAAVGLALVAGVVLGGMVGNPFGRSASASTPAVGGRLISLGTVNLPPGDPHEFAIVDVRDCASLYVMYQASDTCTIVVPSNRSWSSPDGSTRVGQVTVAGGVVLLDGHSTVAAQVVEHPPYVQPLVQNACGTTTNVTGWLWCATSPAYAVGGIAELPPLASAGGSGMGGTTYAVLAGAVAGALAFAVLATLSVKKRGV